MRSSNILFTAAIAMAMTLSACSRQHESDETTTSGHLRFSIPQSLAPALTEVSEKFLELYKPYGATFFYDTLSETAAKEQFFRDTIRILFTTQPLSKDEQERAKKVSENFREMAYAYDAVMVITNPKNPVAHLTTTEIRKILSGSAGAWSAVSDGQRRTDAIHVYLHDSSDISAFLARRLALGNVKKTTGTISDQQTIDRVLHDPQGIGFVSLDWLDTSATPHVNVLELGKTKEDADTSIATPANAAGKYFSAHPAYLFKNYYPFKRTLYLYTRTSGDLANGFEAFVASADAQKLLLQRGILPGTQHIRIKTPFGEE